MIEQHSIETTRLSRGAALVGSGARVGVNYLKFYARRALSGKTDERALHEENADEVYRTFSRLKGGPLKLAQMLSIDRNLLPPAYASRFAQAQYSAPPLSYPLVVRTFRREFGCEPGAMFDSFTRQAAHGASIGQVHLAAKNGQEFAVKVQYPGVADSLRSDLRVIKPIALQVLGLREKDVEDYFHEIEARLLEETNYALELQRSIELSRSSAHLENVRFPVYYAALSSDRILTMDWVEGLPLDRFADGDATGQERDQIGQAPLGFLCPSDPLLKGLPRRPAPRKLPRPKRRALGSGFRLRQDDYRGFSSQTVCLPRSGPAEESREAGSGNGGAGYPLAERWACGAQADDNALPAFARTAGAAFSGRNF
ncbi:MAG TPA: AarF/UbiB family protein [Terrimicrobiaceae bacterium]|nr:AarF/UbiB family protein [Terrimicrobiaceae bacterium]